MSHFFSWVLFSIKVTCMKQSASCEPAPPAAFFPRTGADSIDASRAIKRGASKIGFNDIYTVLVR